MLPPLILSNLAKSRKLNGRANYQPWKGTSRWRESSSLKGPGTSCLESGQGPPRLNLIPLLLPGATHLLPLHRRARSPSRPGNQCLQNLNYNRLSRQRTNFGILQRSSQRKSRPRSGSIWKGNTNPTLSPKPLDCTDSYLRPSRKMKKRQETIKRVEKARAELLESVSELKADELLSTLVLLLRCSIWL